MQKSRFLIAAALAALAFCASAFAASPPDASGYPMATQSVSVGQHTPAAAPVAVHGAMDVSPVSLMPTALVQTDCSSCRVAVHPGCGQREQHPSMAKGKKGGGGKRCIDVSALVAAWHGAQKVVRLGSIEGGRFIRST